MRRTRGSMIGRSHRIYYILCDEHIHQTSLLGPSHHRHHYDWLSLISCLLIERDRLPKKSVLVPFYCIKNHMSDLYRSAMSARLAKLPRDLPPHDEDEEKDEEEDSLGSLPGSGMGPPAMQVEPSCLSISLFNREPKASATSTRQIESYSEPHLFPHLCFYLLR